MATSTSKPEDKKSDAQDSTPTTTSAQTSPPVTSTPVVEAVQFEDGVPRTADGEVELLPTNPEGRTDGVDVAVSDLDPDKVPTTKKELDAGDFVVRYKGILASLDDGRRIITKEDWAARGIDGQETVAFVKGNGFTVPTKDLSAAALAYCRDIDPGLVIERV